jgi:hypothetical protein
MANMFNRGLYYLGDAAGGRWNDPAVLFKCCLVTVGYGYSPDHNVYADLTNEITNPGYVAGGNLVAGRTCTEDDALDQLVCAATAVQFTSLGVGDQPFAAVVYLAAGGTELISYNVLTAPPAPDGSNYVITWAANGVFRLRNV